METKQLIANVSALIETCTTPEGGPLSGRVEDPSIYADVALTEAQILEGLGLTERPKNNRRLEFAIKIVSSMATAKHPFKVLVDSLETVRLAAVHKREAAARQKKMDRLAFLGVPVQNPYISDKSLDGLVSATVAEHKRLLAWCDKIAEQYEINPGVTEASTVP